MMDSKIYIKAIVIQVLILLVCLVVINASYDRSDVFVSTVVILLDLTAIITTSVLFVDEYRGRYKAVIEDKEE